MYGDQVERANGTTKEPLATPAKEAMMLGDTCAMRQTARNALLERAMRLREEARQVEGLARAIPENFPVDADVALWRLVMSSR